MSAGALEVTGPYVLRVDGVDHVVDESWIGESLLHVLRERVGRYGAKNACEQGECGSCSVVVDGALVCSCLELAAAAVGTDIRTVADVGTAESLGIVQEAMLEAGAVQCGFCTPGLVVAIDHLLAADPDPSETAVREALSGNLCRCTGYGRIFAAVELAVEARRVGR